MAAFDAKERQRGRRKLTANAPRCTGLLQKAVGALAAGPRQKRGRRVCMCSALLADRTCYG